MAVAMGSCVCTTAYLLPLLASTRSVHVVLRGPTIACPARLVQFQRRQCSPREACRQRGIVRRWTYWQGCQTWGMVPAHTPQHISGFPCFSLWPISLENGIVSPYSTHQLPQETPHAGTP